MPHHSRTDIALLLTGAFHGFGGIESCNRSLIYALDQIAAVRAVRVQVLSLLDAPGASSAFLCNASGRLQFRGFGGSHVRFALSACHIARSAEVVIIGHANLLPLVRGLNGSFKCLIAHGIEVWKQLPYLQRWGAERLDRILCVSAYTQREMMRFNSLQGDRFRLFPNTLEPVHTQRQELKTPRSGLGLPPGPMLLSVSRLASSERYKNIAAVINALPEVLRLAPDAFYVIVGEGAERKVFQDLARNQGLADKVLFPGSVAGDLLPSYYAAGDIFVLPSTKEGFGIVFLEAMCHGKPCIGACAGGVPEVVQDGVTGLLVDPGDLARGLPQAILRLITNPRLAQALGERGREAVEGKFSFPHFRGRLEQILFPADARELGEPLCAASRLA